MLLLYIQSMVGTKKEGVANSIAFLGKELIKIGSFTH